MTKQKGVINIVLLMIVVAVVGALVYVVAKRKSPAPTPPASKDDTVNWKTYSNQEYGFEFKYPGEWQLRIEQEGGLQKALPLGIKFDTGTSLDLRIEADYHTFDYAESHVGFDGQKNIGGKTVYFVNITGGTVYWLKGTDNRAFSLAAKYPSSETPEVVYNIISTFQFTKTDQTAGWKTYVNAKYGFEIKYPSGLVAETVEGSSNFEKSYLSVDIGTADYIKQLKSAVDSEGPPLFFRLVAHEPKEKLDPNSCGEDSTSSRIIIDGLTVTKCERKLFGSVPSVTINFTKNQVVYFGMESNHYQGEEKKIIDLIISTFKFTN